jgi:uncharacterized protein with von Willebrand factor type A (vWA) domain
MSIDRRMDSRANKPALLGASPIIEPSGDASRLAENITHFARVLRRAGLPVGPGKVLAAIDAVRLVGIERRADVRSALAATLVDRAEQRALFEQAFLIFWRDPKLLERVMHLLLPQISGRLARSDDEPDLNRRVAEAFRPQAQTGERSDAAQDEIELDAALTFSAREILQNKDFESMSAAELAQAKHMLHALRLPLPRIATRRFVADQSGRGLDLRATLRKSLRLGGEWIVAERRRRRFRTPALITLCDVSGSMARYSRMLLHFMHGLTTERKLVFTFTFGTRLTNITRQLQHRDIDRAMQEVSRAVPDWSGGTRIGACLHEFNLCWSRRVLAQGAVVLLITDGLDCGEGPDLAAQMNRLRRSCRQVLWLNPLLRFGGFEPRPAGIRAMLPHVDRFLPAHNVASLKDLGRALAQLSAPGAQRLH